MGCVSACNKVFLSLPFCVFCLVLVPVLWKGVSRSFEGGKRGHFPASLEVFLLFCSQKSPLFKICSLLVCLLLLLLLLLLFIFIFVLSSHYFYLFSRSKTKSNKKNTDTAKTRRPKMQKTTPQQLAQLCSQILCFFWGGGGLKNCKLLLKTL